jgi:hypothetical protein
MGDRQASVRSNVNMGVSASIQYAAAFRDEHVELDAKLEGSRLA